MPDLKDLELPKPRPVLISTDQSLSQNIKEMLWIHLFQKTSDLKNITHMSLKTNEEQKRIYGIILDTVFSQLNV